MSYDRYWYFAYPILIFFNKFVFFDKNKKDFICSQTVKCTRKAVDRGKAKTPGAKCELQKSRDRECN